MVDNVILHCVQIPPVGDFTPYKLRLLEQFCVGYGRDGLPNKGVEGFYFIYYLLFSHGLRQVTAVFVGISNVKPGC